MSLLDGFDDDQQDIIDEPQMLDGLMPATNAPDEEAPMFSLAKVDYKPNGLKYMVVSNDVLVMAQLNVHIIRLNLQNPEDLEDIEISRRLDDQIHKIFLDTLGHHLIISMESKENYYIHSSWKKPKQLPKLRGLLIDSVAWLNSPHPNAPTVNVLLGTSDGRIFETIIETTEKKLVDFGGKEQYLKLLYVLGDKSPITGMRAEKFPPHPDPNKHFIMVTTASRNYQFIGGPTMEDLFQGYDNNPGFQEMPGTPRSELVFYSKPNSLPRSFAWSTEPGIYHGDMVFRNQQAGDKVVVDTELLPYPKKDNKGIPIAPLSMTMSEFHFLLLYEDQLQVICKLNAGIVFENDFSPRQMRLRGIAHDFVKGTVWIYGEQVVYEVVITNEDRDVWKLFLEKNQFSTALQYCKEPNARDKKDRVWTVQAENSFSQGKYDEAATYFAKTARVFEEVTLKFININERDALKTYLLHKLDNLKPKEATQRTIVCTWLTEIYVNKLNILKNKKPTGTPQQQQQATAQVQQQYTNLQKEFRSFLTDHKEHLNQTTTFNIISSHGCIEELIFYATLIEDFERVISHHIQHADYIQALAVLDRLAASGSVHEEVFYKFSPVLFHYSPQETVNVWIKASFLNPSKLIPALMRYDPQFNSPKSPHQAIRYLQHCVGNLNNKDPTIHNYLLSLYAKQQDPNPLLSFLASEKYFDLKYALRLCTKEQQLQACVLIYSAMGLYEEAVDLALKVDIKLAKENADKPEDDEALRKKLWLRIAKHVVEERKDIKEAMAFLQQCDLLKIEDILPFFPDFVLIADFKEQICKSLEEYNRHIEDLKEEMNDATRSADLIRLDIKELRNKYGFVAASQKCYLCGYLVLTKQFYLFPCQHVFHSECLVQEMMKHLNAVQRVRVKELQLKLAAEPTIESPIKAPEDITTAVSTTDILKNELDEHIASECVFCGDVMIKSIDRPFVSSTEPDLKSWAI